MPVGIENQAYGLLAGGISDVALTFSLQAGHGARFGSFPAGTFKYAALIRTDGTTEFVKITSRSTDSLTVVRGQQGSTAVTFSINDRIEMCPDKGTMAEFPQLGLAANAVVAAGTVSAMTATLASGGDAASLSDGFQLTVTALGANTSTAPTFNLTIGTDTGAKIIVRPDGSALATSDIPGAGFRMALLYNLALDRWVLQNPAMLSTSEIAQVPHWGMNAVINGDMRFAQRGTIADTAVGNAFAGYTLDRWQSNRSGDATGLTTYRSADTDVPVGSQYAMIMQRTVGNASTAACAAYYSGTLEDTLWLRGQQVAFTFKAKCGANYSGATLAARLYTTATYSGTDARVYNFTAPVEVVVITATLTTGWQQFIGFGTIPTDTKQFGIVFNWAPSGVAGADDTVRITRVRVVPAIVRNGLAVAAPVVPPIPFEVERGLCERFCRVYSAGDASGQMFAGAGYNLAGSGNFVNVPFAPRMRVTPTVDFSGVTWNLNNVGAPVPFIGVAGMSLSYTTIATNSWFGLMTAGQAVVSAEV
jgi:hypothetical protein